MKLLVKLGGTLLDAADSRDRLARQIAAARSAGHEITVVHGGGKQMTRYLTERGIQSTLRRRPARHHARDPRRRAQGLRRQRQSRTGGQPSTAPARLPSESPASIASWSRPSRWTRRSAPSAASPNPIPRCLHLLTANGYVPVVACVAGDRQGNVYNVNADQMAVACAAAFGAHQLIFLTDVEGVLDGAKQVRPLLTAADSRQLIADGIATGGMQAKLNAALSALDGGVEQVRIAPGAAAGVLDRILAGEELGTRMVTV